MRKPLMSALAGFLLIASAGVAPDAAHADAIQSREAFGIPPTAIELRGKPGRRVWAEPRAKGRWGLYEALPDGQLSGASGDLDDLAAAYPDIDFSPLREAAGDAVASPESGKARGIDSVIAARDALADATPGAREAIDRALHKGQVVELTAATMTHMIEGMGGRLDVDRAELDRLLATNANRIGLTQKDMKILIAEAGPDGISLAQIEEMMPPPDKALPPSGPSGRTDRDCPGLVYGSGKREICLPLGALSFADVAVRFAPGKKPSKAPFDFPGSALGEPNYRSTASADFISLGCDGALIVQFTDNVLVDVPGVDLYIFEIGPIVERTFLAISRDGTNWIEVGVIEGARSDVDIGSFVEKGDKFSFVRLTNAGKACGGNHSGADIDAIAAVGAEIRLSLDSALLFAVGRSDLKPEALVALDALAGKVAAYGRDIRITVEGHTDSTGGEPDNLKLSEARAKSVWAYLSGKLQVPAGNVAIRGYGESRPIADNDTEEGRQANRRVDLLIAPMNRFVK